MRHKSSLVIIKSVVFFTIFLLQQNLWAQVVASFQPSASTGCGGLLVGFTNNSTGSNLTYNWDFGNGNSSNLITPTTSYNTPGTYTVTLTASSGNNSSTATTTITVYKNPIASFSAKDTFGCAPLLTNFTDGSASGSAAINSWTWDFGDATTAGTTQNPSHSFTSPGSYTVTLLVSDANGCQATFSRPNQVTVSPSTVQAGFLPQDTISCSAPATFTFTNTSTGTAPLTYNWAFSDGNTSTTTNPSNTFNSLNVYTVTLTTTNNVGCTSSKTGTVTLVGPPNSSFTVAKSTLCLGDIANFTNTSSPAPTHNRWDFGDGDTSISFSPNHLYAAPGTYTVKLVTTFGGLCKDSMVQTNLITVNPVPNPLFRADSLVACQLPFTVNFTDSTLTATRWSWSFGDGGTDTVQKPNHTYTTQGTMNVQLKVTSNLGCSTTLTLPHSIKIQLPTANITFAPTIGCTPMLVRFNDSLSTSVQPFANFHWNFKDSASTTLDTITTAGFAPVTHIYHTGNFYYPVLTVTNSYGCKAVDSVKVAVYNHPIMGFKASVPAPDSACALSVITFTDTSKYVNTWKWFYGDSTTGNGIQSTHYYKKLGLFNIKLIVSNPGCTDSLIKTNYIHIKPGLPEFNSTYTCVNLFQRAYTNNSIGVDKFYWNFGDNSPIDSTHYNPIHKFPTTGIFVVNLKIVNTTTGCVNDTVLTEHIIKLDSSFIIKNPQGCPGTDVQFTPKSAIDPTINYLWTFGDGNSNSTQPQPNHTYINPGLYSIKLVVQDQIGCKDSLTKVDSVKIYRLYAGFKVQKLSGCDSLLVQLTDSSVATPPIQYWKWNYGDGTTDSTTTSTDQHYIRKVGNYNLQLTTTNADGTCTSAPVPITYILPIAKTSYTTNYHCPGVTLSFTDNSLNTNKYIWNFGDLSPVNNQISPTHNFSKDGTYIIHFIAKDSTTQCTDSILDTVKIAIHYPKAQFYSDSLQGRCTPYLATYHDNSLSPSTITSRDWTFGDGSFANKTTTDTIVSHTYFKVGTYSLKLVITNSDGCQDSISKPGYLSVAGPYGSISDFKPTGCSPHTVNFDFNVKDAKSFTVLYGDGNSNTFKDTCCYSYTYSTPISKFYYPTLVMTDTSGCQVFVPLTDTIKITSTPKAAITYTPTYPSAGATVDFRDNSGQDNAWQWNFGDGSVDSSSVAQDPTHAFKNGGRYTLKFVANNNGCKDSLLENITVVEPLTPPNVFTPNGDGKDDNLIISSPGIVNLTCHIYNRWGLEVFYRIADTIVWDGYDTAGLQVPEGTYYYVVTGYSLQAKTSVTKKGFIQLIR